MSAGKHINLKQAREEDRLNEFIEQEEAKRDPVSTSIFRRLLDVMASKKRPK